MKSLALRMTLLCCLAPMAGAQFGQFSWVLDNPDGLEANLTATSIGFSGLLGGFPSNISVKYSTVSPVDAFVTVHVKTIALDGECGSSEGFFGESSQPKFATDCYFDANVTFTVHAGATMDFGFKVFNGSFPGDVYYTNFLYRPFWLTLGGALAGSAGVPALSGHGVLTAGEPFGIELANAAPAAATALVLGLGQSNLPFKGGILVPTPTVIVTGLATDNQGALALNTTWPNTPPGTVFVLQAWIADAGAPQGFAASNAVQAFGA